MLKIGVVLGFVFLATVLAVPALGQMTTRDWVDKGDALYNQSKYDEAIQAYDRAIQLKLDCAESWDNKGETLLVQGKYDEAIQAFDKAIVLKPDNAKAWGAKGLALNLLGRNTEADVAFAKAKELGYNG